MLLYFTCAWKNRIADFSSICKREEFQCFEYLCFIENFFARIVRSCNISMLKFSDSTAGLQMSTIIYKCFNIQIFSHILTVRVKLLNFQFTLTTAN